MVLWSDTLAASSNWQAACYCAEKRKGTAALDSTVELREPASVLLSSRLTIQPEAAIALIGTEG